MAKLLAAGFTNAVPSSARPLGAASSKWMPELPRPKCQAGHLQA